MKNQNLFLLPLPQKKVSELTGKMRSKYFTELLKYWEQQEQQENNQSK